MSSNKNSIAKEKICEALISLLQKKSIDNITVSELINKAGVNRSTYYYHFYGIQEVLNLIFAEIISGVTHSFIDFVKNEKKEESTAIDRYEYLLTEIDNIKILFNSGFKESFINRLVSALDACLHEMNFTYIDRNDKTYNLSDGLLYDIKIKEYVFSVIADIEFWLECNDKVDAEHMSKLTSTAKDLRLIDATLK